MPRDVMSVIRNARVDNNRFIFCHTNRCITLTQIRVFQSVELFYIHVWRLGVCLDRVSRVQVAENGKPRVCPRVNYPCPYLS